MLARAPKAVPAALLLAAAALLIAHSLVWNFVTDDAFISFVYSRNLAEHGQLVFNLGERVEGYTNFLWTVLLAGLLKVGLAPELMSRLLGTGFAIATMGVCADLSRRARAASGSDAPPAAPASGSAWDALPALLLAGVPGYACWASGGLETQMFTFFTTLGAARYLGAQLAGEEARVGGAVAFGLAALTRPEGFLFFALTGAHRLAHNLRARRLYPSAAELRALGAFLALTVPHLVWRRWYYGWWLPNTFYIKASGGAGTWAQGGYYLMRLVEQLHLWAAPLLILPALGLRRVRATRALVAYATLIVAVFALYVASVGGDFMGLFRFFVPVLPLVALCTSLALRDLIAPLTRPAQAVTVALLLVGHGLHAREVDARSLVIGADRGIDTPGFLRWYTADRAAIGRWFAQYAQPDDYAAVGGAGAQVYYSRIRSLDCYGLSDAHIAHEVRPVSNRPGHQKYAPLEYQLARRPTIITSNYYRFVAAPYAPPPWEVSEWRQRGYRYVSVRVPGLSSPWYAFLLRADRRLGPLGPADDLD
jgi:hypothetical protein